MLSIIARYILAAIAVAASIPGAIIWQSWLSDQVMGTYAAVWGYGYMVAAALLIGGLLVWSWAAADHRLRTESLRALTTAPLRRAQYSADHAAYGAQLFAQSRAVHYGAGSYSRA